MYSSTEIYIPVQQYIFHYTNMFFSTTIYIPVQKHVFQYKNIYASTERCIFQYRYIFLFRYRIISSSTEIYIRVRKYVFQYRNMFEYRNMYVIPVQLRIQIILKLSCMESREHRFEAEFPVHSAVSWQEL